MLVACSHFCARCLTPEKTKLVRSQEKLMRRLHLRLRVPLRFGRHLNRTWKHVRKHKHKKYNYYLLATIRQHFEPYRWTRKWDTHPKCARKFLFWPDPPSMVYWNWEVVKGRFFEQPKNLKIRMCRKGDLSTRPQLRLRRRIYDEVKLLLRDESLWAVCWRSLLQELRWLFAPKNSECALCGWVTRKYAIRVCSGRSISECSLSWKKGHDMGEVVNRRQKPALSLLSKLYERAVNITKFSTYHTSRLCIVTHQRLKQRHSLQPRVNRCRKHALSCVHVRNLWTHRSH